MKINLEVPIKSISGGTLEVKPQRLYMRVLNGQQILQHCPVHRTARQIAASKAFGLKYGTARKKSAQ